MKWQLGLRCLGLRRGEDSASAQHWTWLVVATHSHPDKSQELQGTRCLCATFELQIEE